MIHSIEYWQLKIDYSSRPFPNEDFQFSAKKVQNLTCQVLRWFDTIPMTRWTPTLPVNRNWFSTRGQPGQYNKYFCRSDLKASSSACQPATISSAPAPDKIFSRTVRSPLNRLNRTYYFVAFGCRPALKSISRASSAFSWFCLSFATDNRNLVFSKSQHESPDGIPQYNPCRQIFQENFL